MDIQFAPRPADALQQAVALEHLLAMCTRLYGSADHITAIHELSGGTMNNVYRIVSFREQPSILRVAPNATNVALFRHEQALLQREYAFQPYLAPIGTLLPAILLADFTHTIVDRDYLFHMFIEGDRWQDVHRLLSGEEQVALWQQLGSVTKSVHNITSTGFSGLASPLLWPTWSDALIADFHAVLHDPDERHIPCTPFLTILAYIEQNRWLFNAVATPQLLHGDLWMHNILVQRSHGGCQIVGVLDAGFAQWGDPAADWTMMRMAIAAPQGAHSFWETYGRADQSPQTRLRAAVYQARSIAYSLLELQRRQHSDTVWLWDTLAQILTLLHANPNALTRA